MPKATKDSATEERQTITADMVTDNDYDTYWTMGDSSLTGSITLEFGENIKFDIVQFQEYIPIGQRVEGWSIDVKTDGSWQKYATGSTIGYKRIVQGKFG